MGGRVFKRCTKCRREVTGRRCTKPGCAGANVVWAFVVNLTRGGTGARRRLVRSGFQAKQEAERAQAELVAETLSGYVAPAKITVKAYLIERWLPRTRTLKRPRFAAALMRVAALG